MVLYWPTFSLMFLMHLNLYAGVNCNSSRRFRFSIVSWRVFCSLLIKIDSQSVYVATAQQFVHNAIRKEITTWRSKHNGLLNRENSIHYQVINFLTWNNVSWEVQRQDCMQQWHDPVVRIMVRWNPAFFFHFQSFITLKAIQESRTFFWRN